MAKKGISFDRIKKTGEDLSNLEINTIVKSEMFATKPSDNNKTALYQLAKKYSERLKELGNKYRDLIIPDSKDQVKVPEDVKTNIFRHQSIFKGAGIFAFREFTIWAKFAIDWIETHSLFLSNSDQDQQTDINLLRRIEVKSLEISGMLESSFEERHNEPFSNDEVISYSDKHPYRYPQIWLNPMNNQHTGLVPSKGLTWTKDIEDTYQTIYESDENLTELESQLAKLKKRYSYLKQNRMLCVLEEWREEFFEGMPIELDLKHRIILHKSLDLGTEHIVMQTKISLDGDITTRVSEKFAANPHQFVIDMHNSSIDISVSYWEKIFDALVGFVTKILSKF